MLYPMPMLWDLAKIQGIRFVGNYSVVGTPIMTGMARSGYKVCPLTAPVPSPLLTWWRHYPWGFVPMRGIFIPESLPRSTDRHSRSRDRGPCQVGNHAIRLHKLQGGLRSGRRRRFLILVLLREKIRGQKVTGIMIST